MTKTSRVGSFYKIVLLALCVLFAVSCALAGVFFKTSAEDTVSATSVFSTDGAVREEGYEYLTYSIGDDGGGNVVAFRRDLALKWYALSDEESSNEGEVQYFSLEIAFESLNFTSFTMTMETTQMSMSEDEMTANTVTFTPGSDEASLTVSVNDEEEGSFAYTAGGDTETVDESDTIRIAFTGDDSDGTFATEITNQTALEAAETAGTDTSAYLISASFTNIGKYFADYASASSSTPITPIEFTTDTGSTVKFSVRSLNGQSFELEDEEIVDDQAPVLVLDSEIKQFVLGTSFDFDIIALDVCDSSVSSAQRTKYYYTNPFSASIVFEEGILQTEDSDGEDIYTVWDTTKYFVDKDFTDGTAVSVSVAYCLEDDSDNEGWYLVEWYGDYAVDSELADTGIPVADPDEIYIYYPSCSFYDIESEIDADEGIMTPLSVTENEDATAAYQEAVTAASKRTVDGEEQSIQVGDGAYFYLPSLKSYFSDDLCGYTDLTFTIYYMYNNGSISTTSGDYDELCIEVDQEGTYSFAVVVSNTAGRAMQGVFESASGAYEYQTISSSNIMDALNIKWFSFSVDYQSGPSVELPESTDIGYVDVTYTFDSFEIVSMSGYQTSYTLYYIELGSEYEYLNDSDQSSVILEYIALGIGAEGGIAASLEDYEAAESGYYVGYLREIDVYDSDLDDDEGDNPYEWNGSSLSFVPQEIGYYVLSLDFASYPWSYVGGVINLMNVVFVSSEADIMNGESEWLQDNILSVVFLSIGGGCLIAIVVLLLIRPLGAVKVQDEDDEFAEDEEEPEKKLSVKEKRKQRKKK